MFRVNGVDYLLSPHGRIRFLQRRHFPQAIHERITDAQIVHLALKDPRAIWETNVYGQKILITVLPEEPSADYKARQAKRAKLKRKRAQRS